MCLIVAKPKGTPLPEYKDIQRWFENHPHGFGLAYTEGDHVRILKGAMSAKKAIKLVKQMARNLAPVSVQDVDVVMHFRQATGGSVSPQNCHPFPVTNDQSALSARDTTAGWALVHNGIIWDYSGYYRSSQTFKALLKTDTQQFIEEHLVNLIDLIDNPAVVKIIKSFTDSKFALLSPQGIQYIGEFVNDNGYLYSNGGYLYTPPAAAALPIKRADLPSRLVELPTARAGGLRCDFCEQYAEELYRLPEDPVSLICDMCYMALEGDSPSWEDRYYSIGGYLYE